MVSCVVQFTQKIESKNLIFQMEALNKRLGREESGKSKWREMLQQPFPKF